MDNWQKLKSKVAIYELYVEDIKARKGIVGKLEYKKHKWFIEELKQIIKDLEEI